MIDRVRFIIKDVDQEMIKDRLDMVEYGVDHLEAYKFRTEIRGMSFTSTADDKLQIKGSLHKFAKGNNYERFKYSEAVEALLELEKITGIELSRFKLTNIEIGVNIPMSKEPMEFIKKAKYYKKYNFIPMTPYTGTSKIYGSRCKLTDYEIKLYDKMYDYIRKLKPKPKAAEKKILLAKNILRFEVTYSNKKLKDLKLKKGVTAEKLLSPKMCQKFGKMLTSVVSEIIFYDLSLDYSKVLHRDVKSYIFVMTEGYQDYLRYLEKELGTEECDKEIRTRNRLLRRVSPHKNGKHEEEFRERFANQLTEVSDYTRRIKV